MEALRMNNPPDGITKANKKTALDETTANKIKSWCCPKNHRLFHSTNLNGANTKNALIIDAKSEIAPICHCEIRFIVTPGTNIHPIGIPLAAKRLLDETRASLERRLTYA